MAPFGTVVLTPYPYNVAELAVQCQIKICVQCIFQAKSCQREAIPWVFCQSWEINDLVPIDSCFSTPKSSVTCPVSEATRGYAWIVFLTGITKTHGNLLETCWAAEGDAERAINVLYSVPYSPPSSTSKRRGVWSRCARVLVQWIVSLPATSGSRGLTKSCTYTHWLVG